MGFRNLAPNAPIIGFILVIILMFIVFIVGA